jgi:hypothetical protein
MTFLLSYESLSRVRRNKYCCCTASSAHLACGQVCLLWLLCSLIWGLSIHLTTVKMMATLNSLLKNPQCRASMECVHMPFMAQKPVAQLQLASMEKGICPCPAWMLPIVKLYCKWWHAITMNNTSNEVLILFGKKSCTCITLEGTTKVHCKQVINMMSGSCTITFLQEELALPHSWDQRTCLPIDYWARQSTLPAPLL